MKHHAIAFIAMVPVLSMLAATPAEKSAETAAREYVNAMEKGSVTEVYSLLPKSYQKDVSTVVSTFGKTMDADVWIQGSAVVGSLADIGVTKPQIVAQMIANGDTAAVPTPEAIASVVKSAKALKALASKLTLDMLKTGDVPKILTMPEFADLGCFSKAVDDDMAGGSIVGARQMEGGSVSVSFKDKKGVVEETELVQVEGVWVPKDMADGWNAGVADALKNIGQLKLDPAKKQQVLGMLPMIKMGVENAKNAASKDQLQQGMMMAFMPLIMMGMNQGGMQFGPPSGGM
jgi:hypothetical protein